MINPITGRKMIPWADNKKTYGLVAVIILEGALQAFGLHVPQWLEVVTFGGAIAAHRSSITNLASTIEDLKSMVTYQVVTETPSPEHVSPVTRVQSVISTDVYKEASDSEKTALLNAAQKHPLD